MKEITFGVPNGVSLGDLLTLNPLMRQNKNSTIQFSPSKRAIELGELFLGICKVQFVNENEVIINNFDEGCKILLGLGCVKKYYYEKMREIWFQLLD